MPPLIHELYDLSDNTALFDHLRGGGSLTTLAESLARVPTVTKGRKSELLTAVRQAIVDILQDDDSTLHELIGKSDTPARISILGELILTLHALAEGQHSGESVDAIEETAFRLATKIARALEANPPQDTDDAELRIHGIAMREWVHLFARYYKARGSLAHETELLMIRARATNTTLGRWPHLVGEAMVEVALALEPLGRVEMATQCYEGVHLDLRYLIKKHQSYPQYETGRALFWLQRACEERTRLVPDDEDAKSDLEDVRTLRQERKFPDVISEPHFGAIARTYLDRIPHLALIVRDITTTHNEDQPDASVAAICARHGCLSTDVEFYISAIGSYYIRNGILAGVMANYDEHFEEVFAAIDYLAQQDTPESEDGA